MAKSPAQILLSAMLLLAVGAFLGSCMSGSQMREEYRDIAAEVDRLHEPALTCDAEYEQAMAEAHLEFARYTMQRGFYLPAVGHLEVAREHITLVQEIVDERDECFGIFPPEPCTDESDEVDCDHPNCAQHTDCLPCGALSDEVDCNHPNCSGDPRCEPCTVDNPEVDCSHPNCIEDSRCEPCTVDNPEVDCDHANCADHVDCAIVIEEPRLVVVTEERIEISEQINFEFNSARITGAGSFAVLDDVVAVMRENEGMELRIEGHTDSVGRVAYNMRLSQERAESVMEYLVSRGIEARRLVAVGFGPERPIESNETDAGRAANRRVEFHITRR